MNAPETESGDRRVAAFRVRPGRGLSAPRKGATLAPPTAGALSPIPTAAYALRRAVSASPPRGIGHLRPRAYSSSLASFPKLMDPA